MLRTDFDMKNIIRKISSAEVKNSMVNLLQITRFRNNWQFIHTICLFIITYLYRNICYLIKFRIIAIKWLSVHFFTEDYNH